MIDQLVKVKEILKKYNQEHLLYFYDELSYSQKENLLTQILDTDFEKILTLYKNSFKPINLNMDDVSPISHVEINKFNSDQINHYKSIGEKIIKLNQFAVVTMAGGQGSRLGYKGPKGTYELALESKNQKKSLFEIMCDDIKRTNEKYGITIPWYIMTSVENDSKTKDFFELHNFWGYPKDKVKFFT